MKQYDCPFICSSENLEVSYYMTYWDFQDKKLINRGYIFAADSEELQNSIEGLQKHAKFVDIEVLARENNTALVKTEIQLTNAMSVIRKNHGYIVGPFYVRNGREVWQVGFDTSADVENALSELSKKNEFNVIGMQKITIEDFSKVVSALPLIIELINKIEGLSATEKTALKAAIKYGFYEDPKKIKIDELSSLLGVSKGCLSRKLRRVEEKILSMACKIIEERDVYDKLNFYRRIY